MKYVFFHLDTSVDVEAAEACCWSADTAAPHAIPSSLAQINCATVLIMDCGAGATGTPHAVTLAQFKQSETMTEADVLNSLDVTLAIAMAEPGSVIFTQDALPELFYRGLKHRIEPLVLTGHLTHEGRVFGQIIDPAIQSVAVRPTFGHQCAGLDVPYFAAASLLQDDDPARDQKLHGTMNSLNADRNW